MMPATSASQAARHKGRGSIRRGFPVPRPGTPAAPPPHAPESWPLKAGLQSPPQRQASETWPLKAGLHSATLHSHARASTFNTEGVAVANDPQKVSATGNTVRNAKENTKSTSECQMRENGVICAKGKNSVFNSFKREETCLPTSHDASTARTAPSVSCSAHSSSETFNPKFCPESWPSSRNVANQGSGGFSGEKVESTFPSYKSTYNIERGSSSFERTPDDQPRLNGSGNISANRPLKASCQLSNSRNGESGLRQRAGVRCSSSEFEQTTNSSISLPFCKNQSVKPLLNENLRSRPNTILDTTNSTSARKQTDSTASCGLARFNSSDKGNNIKNNASVSQSLEGWKSSSEQVRTTSVATATRGISSSTNRVQVIACEDCGAGSQTSDADEEELSRLEGLPDRVLMYNQRDPVSVLMEFGQTREINVTFTDVCRSGPHHASRFHTAAIVNGFTYPEATGTSKKNAKKAAAIVALRAMYDKGMNHLAQANCNVNAEMREADDSSLPLSHSSRIMYASKRLLELAEETQFINYSKDKVLAAIVLERRGTYTVAGLGTGNRVIQYQHLATNGSRLIHSHAEVIARRAFIRFMLKELCAIKGSSSHPFLSRSQHTGLLKLRDDVKVHLYISRPPCGDAAAFPTITNIPNRMRAIRKQGQLRTIIDDGEGAIPTDFSLPANANGKERLRVMTCSDKILRWNAVGIQGGLLSNFMDPVYLNSLVIGSHTGDQRGHVPRAISGRLKCGRLHEVLLKPYRISSPDIVYPPCSDNYAITKSKQYCITWTEGDPDVEVIDAVTGSVAMDPATSSPSSRVSKRCLLALFRRACHNLNAAPLAAMSYSQAKQAARAFQRSKRAAQTHLMSSGFGPWLSLQQTYGVDNFSQAEASEE